MEIICIYFAVLVILLFTVGIGSVCERETANYVCAALIWPLFALVVGVVMIIYSPVWIGRYIKKKD